MEKDNDRVKKPYKKFTQKKSTYNVPIGLRQKPIRNKAGPLGVRNLSSNVENIDTLKIPKPGEDDIRFLVFGGVEEVGKNMYGIEYKDQIIILDCGFIFSNPNLPGIDLQIPNIKYLEDRKDKIKAMVITHGHLDHIGSIPFVIEKCNYPTIYTRKLTMELIKKRQEEFPHLKPLKYEEVEKSSKIKISDDISLSFFAVTHTIPDSMGVIIETKLGDIVFTGDLKLNHSDGVVDDIEEEEFMKFKDKNVLLTIADSTNAERPGFSVPEEKVISTVNEIIQKAPGRVILGSFASQIERNIKMIEDSIKNGRKVVVIGRSMLTNLTIASELGLLKIPMTSIIPVEKAADYPKDKLVIFATGSQGEEYAALGRISRKENKDITLDKDDTIIFSSSVIPGNEMDIQTLKDRLSRLGPKLITYQTSDVHSSGHANRDELLWIHKKINAKFFVPIHGFHYMLTAHGSVLREVGMKEENIVYPDNGSLIDIVDNGKKIIKRKEKMPTDVTVVDGNAIGVLQDAVIKDRKILAQDGIFVVIALVNQRNRRLKKSPDVISRGFVYLRESQDLLSNVRLLTKKTIEKNINNQNTINIENLKKTLSKELQNFLMAETNKRPIVFPVIFVI